ncbi:diadenosine tetraphosphate hydrolase [Alkalihalobacillus alcalophilus ATCC 27647 = CGMCC 1.3604]|uniref:Diadenosine tetraphosphate hydrolase n=1 Tax=Alkalihalobacillus alcalophilus ATCC 27647 = CGMCC 1.3604 TaxID=1218173 RepID=A0A094YTU8_ALKAL|nr:HIT family protein [Alkalihalobacillus alcalophilus]KGA96902.1 diadenosine tetraphosphate hydrolase [Alkalihalobacillus alcalophilus ATCC 27647 = CGMCC 1.3604]MED1562629.1 HIT family protein [Alkalihalobacillus alcalophilus]THG88611.1 diadenosine tetraphosphate hydrolase [Alkalihalobacillus alcalophilus ATCC 27647 = CGMCC 1.3604]
MDCLICAKHFQNNNILYQDDYWVLTHGPVQSQLLGYLYLEPKRHVENWTEFTDEELRELGPLIKKVETAIQSLIPIERLYSVTISEAVRHIHLHLIPRFEGLNVKGLALIEQATQQKSQSKELSEKDYELFIKKLKEQL